MLLATSALSREQEGERAKLVVPQLALQRRRRLCLLRVLEPGGYCLSRHHHHPHFELSLDELIGIL
jgi:hypothetical protein